MKARCSTTAEQVGSTETASSFLSTSALPVTVESIDVLPTAAAEESADGGGGGGGAPMGAIIGGAAGAAVVLFGLVGYLLSRKKAKIAPQ